VSKVFSGHFFFCCSNIALFGKFQVGKQFESVIEKSWQYSTVHHLNTTFNIQNKGYFEYI